MDEVAIATVLSNGQKYRVGVGERFGGSYFGGPGYDQVIEGPRYGPRRLHHILTLNHSEFGIQALRLGFKVSLYYGICFEGCKLKWERTATAAIRIHEMSPRKSGPEYPYFGFPDVLPYFPLRIIEKGPICAEDFTSTFGNSGLEFDPTHVYVAVSDHPKLGVSLFEPGSDADIVFDYDPQKANIIATNQSD